MTRLSQVAVIPYVCTTDGIEVLLITSRNTRRWVIPKGWQEPEMTPTEAAEQEALEEAGLKGKIDRESIGSYCYTKRLHFFSRVTCEVDVFALRVESQRLKWRERKQRELKWVSTRAAADMVNEPDLARLFAKLEAALLAKSS